MGEWKDGKKHGQGTFTYGKGKWEGFRKYSLIILVSTEGFILGLIGFPHIRKLCGNTKIIRRVFADKLVG